MIPPLPDVRKRSIARWLTDSQPMLYDRSHQTAVLKSRVNEIDKAMMRDFDERDDALIWAMNKAGTWGTESGLQSYRFERMEIWHTVVTDHLPVIFDDG